MKKIRLQLDTLSVQTFDVDATLPRRAGTVVAHRPTNVDVDCSPESGVVNLCYTWDMYDARCVLSRGMEEEWGCTGVCYG